jgi:hypothetical protein
MRKTELRAFALKFRPQVDRIAFRISLKFQRKIMLPSYDIEYLRNNQVSHIKL